MLRFSARIISEILIYLYADVNSLVKRIRKRGREMENDIDYEQGWELYLYF